MGAPCSPQDLVPGGYYSTKLSDPEKEYLEFLRKHNTDQFIEAYCKAHNLENLLKNDSEQIHAPSPVPKVSPQEVEYSHYQDEFGIYCFMPKSFRKLSWKLTLAEILWNPWQLTVFALGCTIGAHLWR